MKKFLLYYYLILLLVLSTWNSETLPPFALRMAYLVAVLIPMFGKNAPMFPCILSMFVIISANRFIPSYMPFMPEYLFVVTLALLLFTKKKKSVPPKKVLIILAVLTFLVDLIHSSSIESITFTIVTVIVFFRFLDSDLQKLSSGMSWSFVVIAAFLCIETIVHRNEATYELEVAGESFDRVGWSDPNYFTGIIGMGVIAALQLLLFNKDIRRWQQYVLIGSILLVFFVSLLMASRGGIAAMVGSSLILLLLSRRRGERSTIILMLLIVFAVVMYTIGAFDLLLFRLFADEGDMSGRTVIWANKLADFAASATPIDWIFGIGHKAALTTSSRSGIAIGFHNDYISFLLSYGIIGLILFVVSLCYPIFKYKNARVTAGMIYLLMLSFSLEPITSGGLGYFYLYFYLCVLGQSDNNTIRSERQEITTKSYIK